MKNMINIYKPLILTCLTCLAAITTSAQVTGDKYISEKVTYEINGDYSATFFAVSSNDKENPGELGCDKDEGTNWKSSSQDAKDDDNCWWICKVDDYVKVGVIELYISQQNRRGVSIKISCSDSEPSSEGEADWEEVGNVSDAQSSDRHRISVSLKGAYIRLDYTTDGKNQVNLNEIHFYGSVTEKKLSYRDISVNHKPAKWYDLAEGYNLLGTFVVNGNDKMIAAMENGLNVQIQNTHTLIETLYVKKGSTTRLRLPDWLNGNPNNRAYQRWYNYETGGTFEVLHNNENDVFDLLTPPEIIYDNDDNRVPTNGEGYRFKNGYIGNPLGGNVDDDNNNIDDPIYVMDFYYPKDDELEKFFGSGAYDNSHYRIACDASGYNDYTAEFERDNHVPFLTEDNVTTGPYEPTLSHRFIFDIIAVDGKTANDIHEVRNITMPATRIPNQTEEMVALTKDARAYMINEPTDGSENKLTVELGSDNTAGISLITTELMGDSRVIHFKYTKTNSDKTESVLQPQNGETPKATIIVKSGDDEVVRFNLTFVEEYRLLTEAQVDQLNKLTDSDDKSGWKSLSYRTPQHLKENYGDERGMPLTELNFDYGTTDIETINYGRVGYYYPFPLAWESSSYGFYDGSGTGSDLNGDFIPGRNNYPEWGNYAVLNSGKYLECGGWAWTDRGIPNPANNGLSVRENSLGTSSQYHLYADVSDRPGVIARLPLETDLCSGTELFVTAWVKSARGGETSNNAAALFTIMGVTENGNGGNTYTPIYSYQTGQIPTTYRNDKLVDLPGFKRDQKFSDSQPDYTGTSNQWLQAYFSFVNPTDQDFDSYALQIDNNSASTDGGDIYIDDIRVYIKPVTPEVTQLTTSCSSREGESITRLNLNFDFERLLSRVGGDATKDETKKIAVCLIDKDVYNAEMQKPGASESAAMKVAKALLYTSDDDSQVGEDFFTLSFNTTFEQNTEYKNNEGLPTGDTYSLYRKDGNSLTTDFYAGVKANHTYYILVVNPDAQTEGTSGLAMFEGFNGDDCAIKGERLITPRNMIRINGEIVDPTLTRCENETYNFTAELRVPAGETEEGKQIYKPVEADVYFDWFFGTEDQYTNDTYGMSLGSALETFRDKYPDATEVTDDMITEAGEGSELGKALAMVKYYAEEAEGAAQGQHPHPLVLHAQTVNITMLKGGLNLIAQPIRIDVGDVAVCWDYIPLTLAVSNAAPTVKPGFNWIKYPDGTGENEDNYENLDPCLRIGLDQIKSVSTENGHTLSIDLHNATFATDGGQSIAQVTDADKKIYLVSTDDPAYDKFFADGAAFDQMSLPSGEITYFKATKYESGNTSSDQNLMKLNFDLTTETETDLIDDNGQKMKFKFEPKEGYTYNFAVHFNEIDSKGEATTACAGHFVLPVKVVPKYVKWDGSADGEGNWNNDTNWKRVSSDELKKASYADDDYMTDGTNVNEGGFVPMLFTKVIMPKDSKIKLYRAGYSNNSWVLGDPSNESDDPSLPTQKPTLNIQYDLMAYEKEGDNGNITTQLYRVNLCDEIHFEEGAEMLRPEYLLYNKAWIDVDVPAGEWTLVSMPLQDVVSGDWYTKASGTEDSEYFTDITFTSDYNRLKPFVTQRTWSDGAKIVENESGNVSASFTTTWSALFNDTSVPYASGNGYSVKTAGIKSTEADKTESYGTLTFRFPKADTSYDYSSASGTIARTNPGRFITDEILKREPGEAAEANKAQEKEMKVTLTNIATRTGGSGTKTRYAIVGNPFMANLDVSKFIEENSSVLEAKYWIDSNVEGSEAGTATQTGDTWAWTETEGNGLVGQYKAFCVQLKANAEPEVEFTPDMAVLSNTTGTTTTNNLVIKAESASGTTSAALAYDALANDGYVSAEDAELITDILGNGDKPSVYTVADNMALSVNKINDIRLIPVGLFAGDDDVTKVTFTGVAALLEPTLYDAEMNTETPLTEGYTLTVEGASHGRYFIRTRGAGEGTTDIEETVAGGDNSVSVYSVEQGKVVVASGAGLKDVMIYSVGGALLKNESVGAGLTACTIDNVDSGVVIVKVVTPEGTTTRKIMVK